MALFKDVEVLKFRNLKVFDTVSRPGTTAPYSGIYRCEGCDREIAANEGHPLPPEDHHQHTLSQGSIRWRVVVVTELKL